jgi:single-stranded-DNA-specific exonuclease
MRWTLKPTPTSHQMAVLANGHHINKNLLTLLIQRGITSFEEAEKFFNPSLSQLHDPFLMKDMDRAVDRINKALNQQETILVYGDYDVDGTTAVALVASYLRTFHPHVVTYIPDRYEEGYGVSFAGIDWAHQQQITLIIALDCGIKAIDKIAYAKSLGIDFIICDHHLPGEQLPEALAVLDPKRGDCSYPYKELCGCGVGFKLIQAVGIQRGQPITELEPYLDLVATAIAADIVPITGENRVFVYGGLQVLNSSPRPGLQALKEVVQKTTWEVSDVVFGIAPRINAAGRMKHGHHAVELLVEPDYEKANGFALEIEQYNQSRRETDEEITRQALELIEKNNEQHRYSTVVYQQDWHKGVIGIVASRLMETYYRPTVVFTQSGDKLAASARSVRHFDIYEALESCSEYIIQFGGHKYAAGLTLLPENLEAFKQKFEEVVATTIHKDWLIREITADLELELHEITPLFYRQLKRMAPFGPGNMSPIFLTRNLRDSGLSSRVGKEKNHLRLVLQASETTTLTGIGFNLGEKFELIQDNKPFDIVYSLDENTWNNTTSIQLKIRDIRPAENN